MATEVQTEVQQVGSTPLKGTHSTNVGWYSPPITACNSDTRDLLERYSHFRPDEVVPRIIEARDRLWKVFPFPTVGQFRFVELNLHRQSFFPRVLESIKNGALFLDVGCCFAQEIRKLALEGAPTANLYGLELQRDFVDLSYDFFGDRKTLKAHFVFGDAMDRSNPSIEALRGGMDVAHLGMVLHLFDLETQTRFCERMVEFMKARPGSLIVGHSAGRLEAREWFNPVGKVMYKHNEKSFERMWEEVGRRTGTRWKCRAWLQETEIEGRHWDDEMARKLVFEVVRL